MFKFQKYLKGGTCGIPYLHVFLLRKQFLLTKKYRTSEVFLAISTFPSSAFSQSSIDFKNFSEALWVFSDLCSWVTHIVARSKNSLKKDSSIPEVPPRFELGSLDSKSKVLTITPWDLAYKLSSAYYDGLLMKVVHKNVILSCRQTIIQKDFQAEFTGNIT